MSIAPETIISVIFLLGLMCMFIHHQREEIKYLTSQYHKYRDWLYAEWERQRKERDEADWWKEST